MVTFGGGKSNSSIDQVSALVFDIGSAVSKVGFAGEDSPRGVFSSSVGHYGPDAMEQKHLFAEQLRPLPGLELKSPIQNGLVQDWQLLEKLWDYSFKTLGVDPSEHPLLFSESSWNPREDREKLCEMAFEKYNMPGFYLGRSAVLSAFAAGRQTALVVDSGASLTSVVPVFDGYIVKKGDFL